MAKKNDAKGCVELAWNVLRGDWPFETELQFDPVRKWRFDWGHRDLKIAIEIEGITTFGKSFGRHQTASGIEGDMEKYNRAAELGWIVLRYSQRMVTKDPSGVVEQIERVVKSR